jgi:tetratricopeptide (TPR) repeat protein
MRPVILAAMVLCTMAVPLYGADGLSEARRLYNQGQFDAAERAARDAARVPAVADAAHVVLGRIQLERYRKSAAASDLEEAITSLRSIDARRLDSRERTELTIGLGEALYLDERYGAAAALFESVVDASISLGDIAHDRVLDWWATAVDRYAQSLGAADRTELYGRLSSRMISEIANSPGSLPAGYWLAASARAIGDAEQALNEALAAWVRASLGPDRGVALRADLDRLVMEGILPDRAARLPGRERTQALAAMVADWEAFKTRWTR